jgi:hypothetical protein
MERLTDEMKQRVKELRAEGRSYASIAAELQVSGSAVVYHCRGVQPKAAAVKLPTGSVFKSNSSWVGGYAELRVASALIARGLMVSRPMVDGCHYDLVVDDGAALHRVQVKEGSVHEGVVVFDTHTTGVDVYAVHVRALDKVYWVPVSETGERGGRLRLTPPKNGQVCGVKMAADYDISGAVPDTGVNVERVVGFEPTTTTLGT